MPSSATSRWSVAGVLRRLIVRAPPSMAVAAEAEALITEQHVKALAMRTRLHHLETRIARLEQQDD